MVCKKLKKAQLADIIKHWDLTFRFLYCCYKYDHDYMATAFKKAAATPFPKYDGVVPIGMHRLHFGVRFIFKIKLLQIFPKLILSFLLFI